MVAEEEPQLVELDAAQDSVLGDYDHLANDLLNLKNRHRYMRHQLAILAKNALIGATENSKKTTVRCRLGFSASIKQLVQIA